MALYFAPINLLSNYVYRHIILKCGADFVFSELILVSDLEKAIQNDKLKLIPEDISRTIFQIGVSSPEDVFQGVFFLKKFVKIPLEININMGCPQSTMQQTNVCGGILYDISLMGRLAKALSIAVKNTLTIPSIKLRLGTDPETVLIEDYLKIIQLNGIKKVYIHARTLRYGYSKPSRYEFLKDLRDKFSEMELIFNGDVDGLESYHLIGGGDVLIARAALSNPFVFKDIKNKKKYISGPYDPLLKDPRLIRKEKVILSREKISLILDYLDSAIKYNLRKRLYCANMLWLTKGVSKIAILNKQLNESLDALAAKKLFETWIEEFNN